jgi:hypothetical protein
MILRNFLGIPEDDLLLVLVVPIRSSSHTTGRGQQLAGSGSGSSQSVVEMRMVASPCASSRNLFVLVLSISKLE